MKLHNLSGREKSGYTTWGCMWERGTCSKETEYHLFDGEGELLPMQSRVTAWWPDGSVKWTAHTADASDMGDEIEVLPAVSGIVRDQHGKDEGNEIRVRQNGCIELRAGAVTVEIPSVPGDCMFQRITADGRTVLANARAVLLLEESVTISGKKVKIQKEYHSLIKKADLIEKGPLQAVVRYEGSHVSEDGRELFPFTLFMKIGIRSRKVDFIHTFFYNGDEEKDFLKGLGVSFEIPMRGALYNRHVKFQGDHGCFHETAAELLGGKGLPWSVYEAQMSGEELLLKGGELADAVKMVEDIPIWSEFELCQDSVSHFSVRKKVKNDDCCYLNCLSGLRSEGGSAVGSENGSIIFALRDFWEKYPSGYTFRNLEQDTAEAVIWLWPPKAEAMDFRHYSDRGYSRYYYEGYDWKGASPYGIACTSEFSLLVCDEMIPSDEAVSGFAHLVKKPPQYIGEPEYYHAKRAFGRWSLRREEHEAERWLEKQLDLAVEFYKAEVKQRNWYGMFDYGDFMHTYDPYRHQWRYDMGGFAWDNTELVPTMWLWTMFMRTGREDIFTLAEKLTRHTSEVDAYHMGPFKGLGSRHNVRHWGCPCKEVRIAMSGHHRYYYYLTGDYRLGDIFGEMKDSECALSVKDPLGAFYDKETMVFPTHARSGPDWSSLCADWLTQWERFGDNRYKEKITTGIEDIKQAPLQLVSGPDYEFDPSTLHLRYIGESATGGTHLQICMGAPEIWLELADILEDSTWTKMLADYGRFYYLSREEQKREARGITGDRVFSLPYMAAALGAFGAFYYEDKNLAYKTWEYLFAAIGENGTGTGFLPSVHTGGNHEKLTEIPWISTNFTAQWCLNVMMALEFIRDDLSVWEKKFDGNE